MKEGYIIRDQEKAHFITATVVDWVDVCPPSRETFRSEVDDCPQSRETLRSGVDY